MYYPSSKNKGAASLFSHMQIVGFLIVMAHMSEYSVRILKLEFDCLEILPSVLYHSAWASTISFVSSPPGRAVKSAVS